MVKIRLRRVGLRNQPSYRIVAADKEKPRDGRFLEILGFYNPRTEPSTIEVKEDRIYHWLSVGAQPSESVHQIFNQIGLSERFERFKSGEDVEKLLEESNAYFASRIVNPKTRRDADAAPKKSKKSPKKEPAEKTEKTEKPEPVEDAEKPAETEDAGQTEQAE